MLIKNAIDALEQMVEAFCVDNFKMTSQQQKAFEAAERVLTCTQDHGHGFGEYVNE